MKFYYLLFLILVPQASPAVPLEGNVKIFEYRESQALNFSIFGQAAKIIYEEMQVESVYDECMGLYFKRAGDFRCFTPGLESDEYSCHFNIDLSRNALIESPPCD